VCVVCVFLLKTLPASALCMVYEYHTACSCGDNYRKVMFWVCLFTLRIIQKVANGSDFDEISGRVDWLGMAEEGGDLVAIQMIMRILNYSCFLLLKYHM